MPAPGVRLEDVTWQEAERALTPSAVVVIPLGAAAKEHGPHLRLDNDRRLAEWLAAEVLRRADVVVAPTLTYHYYPAFMDYPGSTTLHRETARSLTVEVVRGLAAHGPRRFYVLNTGVSTLEVLRVAAEVLGKEGILLRSTDWQAALRATEQAIGAQEGGSHADETETSMMLAIAPDRVDMTRAVKDLHPKRPGGLTRDPAGKATFSPSGAWGDPTLATAEKGRRFLEAALAAILRDIEALRAARA